jgi:dihydrofolate reductase
VFSTRILKAVESADIRFVCGDVKSVHAEMVKTAGEKNVWLMGGGELEGQFHDHGLLDELIVTIGSVTLGAGAPLLPRAVTTPFVLESVEAIPPGFAQLRYRVPHP